MPRSESRISLSIWRNPHFTSLSGGAQWLYFVLCSQEALRGCGVLDYTPTRWSNFAANGTVGRIQTSLAELEDHGFILVDYDADEVWIPAVLYSALSSPNIVTAVRREAPLLFSSTIRDKIWGLLPSAPELAAGPTRRSSRRGKWPKAVKMALVRRHGLQDGLEKSVPCHYCGEAAVVVWDNTVKSTFWPLVIDHILPVSRGGTNSISNAVLACDSCNSKKGQLTADEFMDRLALQGC